MKPCRVTIDELAHDLKNMESYVDHEQIEETIEAVKEDFLKDEDWVVDILNGGFHEQGLLPILMSALRAYPDTHLDNCHELIKAFHEEARLMAKEKVEG